MRLLFIVLAITTAGGPELDRLLEPDLARCGASRAGAQAIVQPFTLNHAEFGEVYGLELQCFVPADTEKGGAEPPGDAAPDARAEPPGVKTKGAAMSKQPQFLTNGRGERVPIEMVTHVDRQRDRLVRQIVGEMQREEARLAKLKAKWFDKIERFQQKSANHYGEQLGGAKGNVTLQSYDGTLRLQRAVQEYINFDERLQIAKQLIDKCITRWSEGSRPEIRALVNDAFQVDKQGNVSTTRILGLRRLAINDAEWKRAMDAIGDSITATGSKSYVRGYTRRGDTEEFVPIRLDISKV